MRSAVAVPLVMTPPAGGGTFPGSTMGVVAYVRQVFLDTRYTAEQVRRYDQDARGKARPGHDRTVQALQGALQAKVPFLLPAGNEVQIDRMIALGREFEVPAVLYGAHEGLRRRRPHREGQGAGASSARSGRRSRRTPTRTPTNCSRPSSCATARPARPRHSRRRRCRSRSPRMAWRRRASSSANVRKAIKAGLPADAALRALTLDAAQIYGVQDRLGSLEAGKIANLIVVQGDLLGDKSTVKHVFVDGRRFEVPADAGAGAAPGAGRGPGARPE